jgi:hypothetical protein
MKTWQVPDIGARLETLRLWREYDQAHKASNEVSLAGTDQFYPEYRRRVDEARAWYEAQLMGRPGVADAEAACEAAREAYFAAPEAIREDDNGEPVICVVTGSPIYDSDEVIETGDGSLILASAFVPREILDQFSGADDDEADIEEAA